MVVLIPPTVLSWPDAFGRAVFADRHCGGELDAYRLAGVSQLQPDKSNGRPDGAACVLQNRKVHAQPAL